MESEETEGVDSIATVRAPVTFGRDAFLDAGEATFGETPVEEERVGDGDDSPEV